MVDMTEGPKDVRLEVDLQMQPLITDRMWIHIWLEVIPTAKVLHVVRENLEAEHSIEGMG